MPNDQVKHIVIIVKENHTFDNYFGTFPGANGAAESQAANPPPSDPDHRHQAWMDRAGDAAHRVQYGEQDIPGYFSYARSYALCDNYFSEVAGPSTPNHLMLIAADSPFINNPKGHYRPAPSEQFQMKTLPDLLEQAGLTWGNYGGYAFQYLQGLMHSQSNHASEMFVQHAQSGQLPNVAWLYGEKFSEHPTQNVTTGMQWTMQQIEAIAAGGLWDSTVVFVTWDDWGGWFDHVTPPVVETWDSTRALRPVDAFPEYDGQPFRYGSRVPCLAISPFAKSGYISHVQHSHVSLLKFCETVFGLPALNQRDKTADDMMDCFDFTRKLPPPARSAARLAMHVTVRAGSPSERVHFAASAGLPPAPKRAQGLPATPEHDLIYRGGKTIPHLTFTNLYVGGAAAWSVDDRANIDRALAAAMSDEKLNNVIVQYFPGAIDSTFKPSQFLLDTAPRTVSRGDVDGLLRTARDAGLFGGFDFGSTVFNLMLPRGTVLTTDETPTGGARVARSRPDERKSEASFVVENEDNSLNGLGGYHGSVHLPDPDGTDRVVYFAIGVYSEPLPDGTINGIPAFDAPWKSVVATFYHELNEARTDADVEEANRTQNEGLLGWVSSPPGQQGEEIGDFPIFEAGDQLQLVFQEVPLADGSGTVPVQFEYSNFVHGPEGPVDAPRPSLIGARGAA